MKLDRDERLSTKGASKAAFEEFEATVRRLEAEVSDPNAGFFGPESVTWMVSREPVLLAMGMRPLLLQIAHPKVAQGVADHSNYKVEPLSRGFRTFDAVYKIVFGSMETAAHTARMVYRIHDRVRGVLDEPVPGQSPDYIANDPELALWVHATLIDSAVLGFETFFRPLTDDERTRYYEESKIFAQLFGVPLSYIPATWEAFQDYCRSMERDGTLYVTEVAKDVGYSLMYGAPPLLKLPIEVYNAIGGTYLSPDLRKAFGMRYTMADAALGRAAIRSIGVVMRSLPQDVRALPAARAAERRIGHGGRMSLLARSLDRLTVSAVRDAVRSVRVQG